MTKKTKEENVIGAIGDAVSKVVKAAVSFTGFKEKVQNKVNKAKKSAISGFMFLVGFVFILIAVVLLLKEFLDISYGISTVGIGAIFILIGLLNKPRE